MLQSISAFRPSGKAFFPAMLAARKANAITSNISQLPQTAWYRYSTFMLYAQPWILIMFIKWDERSSLSAHPNARVRVFLCTSPLSLATPLLAKRQISAPQSKAACMSVLTTSRSGVHS
ncbi:hypothetical protein FGO68_gene6531 [Halteria grandinella]|uniref:Uncharacterized protein n=1 Tax=Halteria grandinella TaxID=5974 RepID=A0A8J8NQ74_HALGN|nr:hypothetical protein FGO68_gene6531 [Halteria grandinella]